MRRVSVIAEKMKNSSVTKVILYCCITSVFWFLYKSMNDVQYTSNIDFTEFNFNEDTLNVSEKNVTDSDMLKLKYILQWTSPKNVPFVYMGEGQKGFIDRNCSFTNCFVTANRSYLSDYTNFDVIAFSGPEVRFMGKEYMPAKRSPHQKYAYTNIESAENYPMCSNRFDSFFNWTWTYRLDSDARWGYFAIRDKQKKIIGPKIDMDWIKLEEMEPVSEKLKDTLRNKTKAAAWFISNCYSRSGREIFVSELKVYLRKYNLRVDIYGECGSMKCPRDKEDQCSKMIEKDYYFYLSFENSFAEDYVTEKLLLPLKNYAVPIVYGGANYTRFMPNGIYLDARQLGVAKLAKKMNELITNPEMYAEMFKWTNHYSYHWRHESIETDDYCRFCSMLNEKDLVRKISMYKNFRQWWDPPNRC